ncbi:MAG: hypothetical protein IKT40_08810 [Bacilli bacterium]|nr:hypothetical protein [Bacilli bacterium]
MRKFKLKIFDWIYNKINETELFYYIFGRKEYIETILNYIEQILENWCLIKYSSIMNQEDSVKLYRNKLFSIFEKINFIRFKDSKENCLRIVNDIFNQCDLYDDKKIIFEIVKSRLVDKEKIKEDSILKQVVSSCYDSLDDIADIISSINDLDKAKEYINNI